MKLPGSAKSANAVVKRQRSRRPARNPASRLRPRPKATRRASTAEARSGLPVSLGRPEHWIVLDTQAVVVARVDEIGQGRIQGVGKDVAARKEPQGSSQWQVVGLNRHIDGAVIGVCRCSVSGVRLDDVPVLDDVMCAGLQSHVGAGGLIEDYIAIRLPV